MDGTNEAEFMGSGLASGLEADKAGRLPWWAQWRGAPGTWGSLVPTPAPPLTPVPHPPNV